MDIGTLNALLGLSPTDDADDEAGCETRVMTDKQW
eukprot:SAG11_NODE_1279_length_5314_cov_3.403835_3_plen_35_part_00